MLRNERVDLQVATAKYNDTVFINCPFDRKYRPIFDAIVFTVFDCGFNPRCALEVSDGSVVRIDKILSIIEKCRYGVHDISRTQIDRGTRLPRFNMPFELGLFCGAKRFGIMQQKRKVCLILDSESYRYQKFISDISGQDVLSHDNDVLKVICRIRDWLRTSSGRSSIPGGGEIHRRYLEFQRRLPQLCRRARLRKGDMIFAAQTRLIFDWLTEVAS